MNLYLNILLSTTIGCFVFSLGLATFVSILNGTFQSMLSFFQVAVLGMLIFGFSGSMIWCLLFMFIIPKGMSETKRHMVAALMGSILCWVPILVLVGTDVNWLSIGRLPMLTTPVALLCVLFFWLLFIRRVQSGSDEK